MNNQITVKIKNRYGNEDIIVTSEHAEHIRKLTRRATLSPYDIEALKALGFTIVLQAESVSF